MLLKNLFSALLCSLLLIHAAAAGAADIKEKPVTLRVGTYNILLGGDLENQQKIKKLVSQLDIDIIAYQEVYTQEKNGVDVLKNLADDTVKTLLRAKAISSGERAGYGTGALSRLKAVRTGVIKIKPIGEEQRVLGRMEFELQKKRLAVYTVHVSWIVKGKPYYCRPEQFKFILDTIKKDTADYKVILGDFNIENYGDYQPFTNAGFKLANTPLTPFKTFRWNEYDHGYQNIDNIMVSPNIDILDPAMVDIALSDHNLLYADLVFH